MGTFIIESIITLRLCIKWRTMITEVEAIERKLPPVNKPRKAVFVANLTMFAIQLCWAVCHWLYLMFLAKMTLICYLQPDDADSYIKSYLLVNYSWLYDQIRFSYFSGLILQVFQAQASFISNFITILVAITSMYLRNRFQTFNRIFFQRQHKSRHSKPSWMELQMYYARLTRLACVVNDYIHPFVFTTFWSDLFFISFQTYYTLKFDKESVAFCVYYFIFSVLKLSLVWFLAAELHETSRKPLNALYTVSSKAYTVEMQRLMTQIYRNKICLSGLNLFDITRGTILTIMATILTYELVLLQI
ncbi:hypothetical protein O3G_MSEX005244 [Manduca sexta]|uniref:Gustatory receptor n=1 Tax=Manduca sexta TaxID=7130 RepID=A0A921YYG6_MANSE|nr:hypothetical protein O3G_MSEX005244 [Manduca sexta]